MKKTLLSILALSAGVAFAQNFNLNKQENQYSFKKSDAVYGANKDYDTLLIFQGADCQPDEIFDVVFSYTGSFDTTLNVLQKFSFSTGGTISEGAAFFAFKKQGAVGGTTNYNLRIYDNTMNLLGTSDPVTFANIQTPTQTLVPTIFTFSTPVTVGTDFFVGLMVNDAVAGTDTVAVFELYPFSGTDASNPDFPAEYVGDCGNGTSLMGNSTLGYVTMAALSQVPVVDGGFGVKLDPKLAIGVVLEVEEISVVNNETISYSIFPNPTSDVLNVQYTLATEGTVTMNVVDLTGRVVRNIVKENQGAFQATEQINIAGLNAGIYLLNVTANGNTTTQKFIVK